MEEIITVVNLILEFHDGRSVLRVIYPFLIYAYILHSLQFHSRNLASLALSLSGGKSWSVPDTKQSHTYGLPRESYPHTTFPCLFCFFLSHTFFWVFQYFPSALTEDFPNSLGSSQEPLSSRKSKFFAASFLTLKMLGSSLSLSAV